MLKQLIATLNQKKNVCISIIREKMKNENFKANHRNHRSFFSRNRL